MKKNILTVMSVLLLFRSGGQFLFAQISFDPYSQEAFIAQFQDDFQSTYKAHSRKSLVQAFCSSILSSSGFIDTMDTPEIEDDFYYVPQHSVFLYILCRNIDSELTLKFMGNTIPENHIKHRKFNTFPLYNESCDPSTDMDDCKFSLLLPQIFTLLINDYANIKLGSILGFDGDLTSIDNQIKKFSDVYFGSSGALHCVGEAGYFAKVDAKPQEHCTHSRTFGLLEKYLKAARQIANSTKILDPVIVTNSPVGMPKTYLQALASTASPMRNFENHLSNEVMMLSLFGAIYAYVLPQNTTNAPMKINKSVTAIMFELQQEALNLNAQIKNIMQALPIMMSMMHNIQKTFPVHIGLMAYYEDVVKFRREFAKIYTPLKTLQGKLQKVQKRK